MEDLRWEVVRLKEEVRAMRRELGEARGAREEMVSIYIHIYTYLYISTRIYTYLHVSISIRIYTYLPIHIYTF